MASVRLLAERSCDLNVKAEGTSLNTLLLYFTNMFI
jgi:hypothetical protein